ncbi:hypothetical protein C8R47DRAFT_1189617 [Mycena vitilis]|nr:hypothetical protein C8R47DRAFT_1189617 [Mycena vitilis]
MQFQPPPRSGTKSPKLFHLAFSPADKSTGTIRVTVQLQSENSMEPTYTVEATPSDNPHTWRIVMRIREQHILTQTFNGGKWVDPKYPDSLAERYIICGQSPTCHDVLEVDCCGPAMIYHPMHQANCGKLTGQIHQVDDFPVAVVLHVVRVYPHWEDSDQMLSASSTTASTNNAPKIAKEICTVAAKHSGASHVTWEVRHERLSTAGTAAPAHRWYRALCAGSNGGHGTAQPHRIRAEGTLLATARDIRGRSRAATHKSAATGTEHTARGPPRVQPFVTWNWAGEGVQVRTWRGNGLARSVVLRHRCTSEYAQVCASLQKKPKPCEVREEDFGPVWTHQTARMQRFLRYMQETAALSRFGP